MFRIVILTDVLQVLLSLTGVIVSLNQMYLAWLAKVDASRNRSEPSLMLVATIRIRRERARVWKHFTFLSTGAAIAWWRMTLGHAELITWVSVTRDLSILVVSFILIRETFLSLSDRREVGALMDAEHKPATNGHAPVVEPPTEHGGDHVFPD